jgi:hypothetical protein
MSRIALLSLLGLLGLGSVGIVMVDAQQPFSKLVRICHFPGHASPAGLHDFVAGNQDPNNTHACEGRGAGSVAIWVAEEACQSGHAATPAPNATSCTNH